LAFEAAAHPQVGQQSGTANNDINALRSMGMFPDGVKVNHYLTDTDAFFIRTNVPQGMKLFQRVKAEFAQDGDFDTGNLKYKGYERYSVGWTGSRLATPRPAGTSNGISDRPQFRAKSPIITRRSILTLARQSPSRRWGATGPGLLR
jgi:hypothetical protein